MSKSPRLELPSGQNFTCQGSTRCCRMLDVPLLPAELARYAGEDWKEKPIARTLGGAPHTPLVRSGACAFLSEEGRCRIHERLGACGKPLTCRIFPYTFAFCGPTVRVGVRFSCPTILANKGEPVVRQEDLVRGMAQAYRQAKRIEPLPRAPFHLSYELSWKDIDRIDEALLSSLEDGALPLSGRLIEGAELLDEMKYVYIYGSPEEVARGIDGAAVRRRVLEALATPPPRLGLADRAVLAAFLAYLAPPGRGRSAPVRLALRLAARLPGRLRLDEIGRVSRRKARKVSAELDQESTALLVRYYKARIWGRTHFGRAFHGLSYVAGWNFLLAAHACLVFAARARAATLGRPRIEIADVELAIQKVEERLYSSNLPAGSWGKILSFLLTTGGTGKRLALRFAR
ncbi:MAG: YkgJ family cysteine cluster protein [Planctomycetes bacterium]|nr:YkgJ family cysteine cluster protein [Planctomycetota bacterium]